MAEKVAEVKTLAVYMQCNKCKNGLMICKEDFYRRGKVGFPHECNICGHEEMYPRMYPCQRAVLAEGLREPTEAEKKGGIIQSSVHSAFLAKLVEEKNNGKIDI
ncbi:MAG: hypothetical protein Q4E24_09765 [bacterium]|nr:hypothetical protein [bacterium]